MPCPELPFENICMIVKHVPCPNLCSINERLSVLNLDSLSGLLHDIIMFVLFSTLSGKLYFGGSVVSLKLHLRQYSSFL